MLQGRKMEFIFLLRITGITLTIVTMKYMQQFDLSSAMESLIKSQREAVNDLEARIQANMDEITKVKAP